MKQKYCFEDDIAYWFTANGNRIPVKSGQTREEALNAFLKEHGDPRGKSVEELQLEQAVGQDGLTSEERRIWREACERIARGFKGIAPSINDTAYIPISNRKIAITTGAYPNFRIERVCLYRNSDEQERVLKKLWKTTKK